MLIIKSMGMALPFFLFFPGFYVGAAMKVNLLQSRSITY